MAGWQDSRDDLTDWELEFKENTPIGYQIRNNTLARGFYRDPDKLRGPRPARRGETVRKILTPENEWVAISPFRDYPFAYYPWVIATNGEQQFAYEAIAELIPSEHFTAEQIAAETPLAKNIHFRFIVDEGAVNSPEILPEVPLWRNHPSTEGWTDLQWQEYLGRLRVSAKFQYLDGDSTFSTPWRRVGTVRWILKYYNWTLPFPPIPRGDRILHDEEIVGTAEDYPWDMYAFGGWGSPNNIGGPTFEIRGLYEGRPSRLKYAATAYEGYSVMQRPNAYGEHIAGGHGLTREEDQIIGYFGSGPEQMTFSEWNEIGRSGSEDEVPWVEYEFFTTGPWCTEFYGGDADSESQTNGFCAPFAYPDDPSKWEIELTLSRIQERADRYHTEYLKPYKPDWPDAPTVEEYAAVWQSVLDSGIRWGDYHFVRFIRMIVRGLENYDYFTGLNLQDAEEQHGGSVYQRWFDDPNRDAFSQELVDKLTVPYDLPETEEWATTDNHRLLGIRYPDAIPMRYFNPDDPDVDPRQLARFPAVRSSDYGQYENLYGCCQ